MSGFSGINQFGNLTVNGQKLTFEDFDKDKNGEISQKEYNAVLKEMKLDKVDLSTVDTNGDKTVSKDEFALWEQKTQMQDAVNSLSATISADFAGKTQCLTELTKALKDLINDYASEYKGDVSKLAEKFKADLPQKYQEIKTSILANDPSTVKSKVLDDIYTQLTTSDTKAGDALPETTAKRIAKELETEADKFLKTYKGTNLEADLKAHLEAYMNKSDAEKLKAAAEQFKTNAGSFGAIIDNGTDLKQLKEYATEFLTAAVEAGVTIKLGGVTIKTTNAITSALAKFTDGDSLKAAMEDVIASLDTETMKTKLIAEEELKAIEAENKKFTDIKGSEYAIRANLIDYSGIEGYFDGSDCTIKKKKKTAELKNMLRDQMYDRLEKLKPQMKEQIKQMLISKGVPFEKVEQVFENIYNQTFTQTFDAEGMVSTKHRTAFRKGWAKTNVKQFVDQFITNFNTNIAAAIDKMNESDKDFDTVDLDLTKINLDENGSGISTVNNDDIVKSYQTGVPLTTKKHGADYYVKIAEQIIDGLKSQMMAKAKAMCSANGVKFDLDKFNTMYNNVKGLAVNACVAGCDKKGRNWGGTGASVAGGAIAGVGALAAATTTATVVTGTTTIALPTATISAGVFGSSVIGGGTATLPLFGTALVTGPVGWIAGGALLAGGILAGIFGFGGDKSQSMLDTRSLVDGFAQTFAQNFSQWVEEEKANAAKQ